MDEASSKYFVGTAHLTDTVPKPDDLGQHLVVKEKVVRILLQGQALQYLPGKGPVARVVFRELVAEQQILNKVRKRLAMYL